MTNHESPSDAQTEEGESRFFDGLMRDTMVGKRLDAYNRFRQYLNGRQSVSEECETADSGTGYADDPSPEIAAAYAAEIQGLRGDPEAEPTSGGGSPEVRVPEG